MRILLISLALFLSANSVAGIGDTRGDVSGEYLEAAETIVESFQTRSGTEFANLLDFDTILKTSVEGMKLSKSVESNMLASFQQAKSDIAKGITASVPEGSLIKLIMLKPHTQGAQALIRMDLGDTGYGYRNFVFSKNKKVKIVDWFDYTTGQTYTDTIRQSLTALLPGKTRYSRLFDMVRGKDETRNQIMEMLQAVSKQDHTSFFSVFDVTDEAARHSRLMLVMAFGMANISGDMQRYTDILSLLDEHHGDNKDLQFILFDHYFTQEQYQRAIDALDGTAKDMGIKDGVNYSLSAVVYNEAGETAKAIEAGEHSLAIEPDVELAYWALLSSYSSAKQFGDAVKMAQQLENQFDAVIDYELLDDDPVFGDMVKSDEFKQWKEQD